MKLRLVALVAALGIGCQVISGVADLEVTSGVDGGSDGSPGSTDGGADALVGDAFVSPYASGTVYYLPAGKTVTLHINGGPPLTVTGAAASSAGNPFKFPDALAVGTAYSVTADPSSDAACWVKNGTGTFTGNLSDLDVRCVLTATATWKAAGTLAATGGPLMTDFPGSPPVTFTTDRPKSDVLLSFYAPAVQSVAGHGKTFFAIEVDGAPGQTVERTQFSTGNEGQSVTVLALTNLAAGSHSVKARWRAEGSDATALGVSPDVLDGPPSRTLFGLPADYTTTLSAVVLDSMSTFDGVAAPVTAGPLFADAGAVLDASVSGLASAFVTAASLPLDGLAGREALALFQAPEATTSAGSVPAGSRLRLALDGGVVATSELLAVSANSFGYPTMDRAQTIATFVDLIAGTKPSLQVFWSSLGPVPETGNLAAGSWLGAVYFKPTANITHAQDAIATVQCFSGLKPSRVDALTTTLTAPRAGKALVAFQGAYMFAAGGYSNASEASVVRSSMEDGGNVETPVLVAYLNNLAGYGQGSTMIAVVDVPKGLSSFDVRLRSRIDPAYADWPGCLHNAEGDTSATSTLGVTFIE